MTNRKPNWKRMSRDAQDLAIKVLWEGGYTYDAIAEFLDTTRGTVAGRIARHPNLDTSLRANVRSIVNKDRYFDLLELYDLEQAGP